MTAAMWAAVRAVRDGIMRYVSQAVDRVDTQRIREMGEMTVVAQAVVAQRIQMLVAQAVERVNAQRVAVVHVGAVATLGGRYGTAQTGQFIRRKGFLLAGVSDERKNCDK